MTIINLQAEKDRQFNNSLRELTNHLPPLSELAILLTHFVETLDKKLWSME